MKFRRMIGFMLILMFNVAAITAVHAEETTKQFWQERDAQRLSRIGMFKGTDKGFELERRPTRVESTVIIVRLLGKEVTAREKNYSHPFTDVPQWASPYVGYLYHENIISGIDDKNFRSNEIINATQFYTLLLRVLGYDDRNGDFRWDQSLDKAVEIGLLQKEQTEYLKKDSSLFIRGDVVESLLVTMNTKLKDSEMRLMDVLIGDEALTIDELLDEGFYAALFEKAVKVQMKGIITYYSDYDKPIIKTNQNTKFVEFEEFGIDEEKYITTLHVVGEDFKEYEILLEKDYQFDPDSLRGKSITFTGELLVNWRSSDPSIRYVELEEHLITGLQNEPDYEPVVLQGQFINYGHLNIGGDTAFMFVSKDGNKFQALLGAHNVIDHIKEKEKFGGMYSYYSLEEFTYQDIWVKGYKKKDSNVLLVGDFGRDYKWDIKSNQWIKNEQVIYDVSDNYIDIWGYELLEIIEDTDDKIIFKASSNLNTREVYQLTFLREELKEKVPNEDFIGASITIQYNFVNDDTTDDLIVKRWNYNTGSNTSSSYGELSRIIDETSKYVEFELETDESLIKKVRFYKRDFIHVDFESLIGKKGYVSGNYIYEDLETIKVLNWIEM